MNEEQILRLFGVQEATVRERLADVLPCDGLSVVLSGEEEDILLHLTAEKPETIEWAIQAITQRLGAFLYSLDGTSLEALTVALLTEKHKTVAVAESCTGGMIASRLTNVPGCSAVFGTGIVSYSWDCKRQLLGVSSQTLESHGAVSAETAREMADGVRRRSGADIGIATTGEAGPQAAEDKPVGTVFVALADAKRTWVKRLQLDATALDRTAMRRVAASHALDLTRRYLQAYPTVMAGGERHTDYIERQRVASNPAPKGGLLATVLPWRGSRKTRLLKFFAWLSVLAVLVFGVLMIYNHILTPWTNRELQDDLADLYHDSISDLTVDAPADSHYPEGMMSQFRSLYDINADVAGWVRIPDTTINYPVMGYTDGYYHNHNFNDQFSIYGQPYFYKENGRDTLQTDRVLAIYGNNTRDEQMFSALASYRRIAFLRENPIIEMNTLYHAAQWEIVAVALVDERARASEFEYVLQNVDDDSAFKEYVTQLRRRSLYYADTELSADDSLLLLVTNVEREYGFNGARLVVVSRCITDKKSPLTYSVNSAMKWPAAYAGNTTTTTTTITTTTTSTTATESTTEGKLTTTDTIASTTATESTTETGSTVATQTTTITDDATDTTESSADGSTIPTDNTMEASPSEDVVEENSSAVDEPEEGSSLPEGSVSDETQEGFGENSILEEHISDGTLTEIPDTESNDDDHFGN